MNEEKKQHGIEMEAIFQFSTYEMDVKEGTFMVQLNAPSVAPVTVNDICLVLDVSGSMADEGKLQLVQNASAYLVSSIPAGNSVAIVSFAEDVQVLTELTPVTNQASRLALARLISQLHASGKTNLCAAILTGIRCLRAGKNSNKTLILLTDGQANVGLVADEQMAGAVNKALQEAGVAMTIHTIGIAHDDAHLNRKFLEQVAGACGGGFYRIRNSDHIATCFGDCFGVMLSLVAKDIKVTITALENSATLCACGPAPVVDMPSRITWVFSDLLAGEQRNIVLGFSRATKATKFHIAMEYKDLAYGEVVAAECDLVIPRPEPPPKENKEVKIHMFRILVSEAMAAANMERMKMYRSLILKDRALALHELGILLVQEIDKALREEARAPDHSLRVTSLQRQRSTGFVDQSTPFVSPLRATHQAAFSRHCSLPP